MTHNIPIVTRRRFLATAAKAGAILAAPMFVPGPVLGKDGGVAASERITLAGIGINGRGSYGPRLFHGRAGGAVRGHCRRPQRPPRSDQEMDRGEVRPRRGHVPRLPRDAPPPGHRRGADRHRRPLAHDGLDLRRQGGQGHLLREALLDDHCREPGPGRHDAALRRHLSGRHAAAEHRQLHFRHRVVPHRQARQAHRRSCQHACTRPRTTTGCPPSPSRPKRTSIGTCGSAQLRGGRTTRRYVDGGWRGFFDFHGGGILEWGAHTVDLCNWAGTNDAKMPVLYEPTGLDATAPAEWNGGNDAGCVATYDDGLKLVMRSSGWMGLGTCCVRYEGEDGWVETGDSGRIEFSSGELRAQQQQFKEAGTSPVSHVKNFLECIKTRKPANSNAEVVARSHIICHAAYIAWQLGRPLTARSGQGRVYRRRRGQPDAVAGAPRAVANLRITMNDQR